MLTRPVRTSAQNQILVKWPHLAQGRLGNIGPSCIAKIGGDFVVKERMDAERQHSDTEGLERYQSYFA